MTEIETIARAQMYLEKLAKGIDPLTDKEIGENDIVNNVRVSRCLFYASDILKQIVIGKGRFKIDVPAKGEFTITHEQLAGFEFSQRPINVSEIVRRINLLIDASSVKELKTTGITNWLVEAGMLTTNIVRNKTVKRPTAAGISLGISTEERTSQYGVQYESVFYDIAAQHFIIDNMDAIIAFNRREKSGGGEE